MDRFANGRTGSGNVRVLCSRQLGLSFRSSIRIGHRGVFRNQIRNHTLYGSHADCGCGAHADDGGVHIGRNVSASDEILVLVAILCRLHPDVLLLCGNFPSGKLRDCGKYVILRMVLNWLSPTPLFSTQYRPSYGGSNMRIRRRTRGNKAGRRQPPQSPPYRRPPPMCW